MNRPSESELRRAESATWGPRPRDTETAIIALDYRPIDKGALLGEVTLWLRPCRMKVHKCLHGKRADGSEWVRLPQQQWTAQNGETRYERLIDWDADGVERRFEAAALAAIHRLVAGS